MTRDAGVGGQTGGIDAASAGDAGTGAKDGPLSSGADGARPPASGALFREAGGVLAMEAEDFMELVPNGDTIAWRKQTAEAGFVGAAYVDTPGGAPAVGWTRGAELLYNVEFTTPGEYFIWMRRNSTTASTNTAHIGFDGVEIGTQFDGDIPGIGKGWSWHQHQLFGVGAAKVLVTAGRHVIHLRRRESAYMVDRILFTTDPARPTGDGPPASPRR